MLDPVTFARDLIRCPSVTPEEGGALQLLQGTLEDMGFTVSFGKVGTVNEFSEQVKYEDSLAQVAILFLGQLLKFNASHNVSTPCFYAYRPTAVKGQRCLQASPMI